MPFCTRSEGFGSQDSGPAAVLGVVSAGIPEDGARDVEVTFSDSRPQVGGACYQVNEK